MAEEVGRLEVVLDARIKQFEQKVDRAEQRMRRSTSRMNRHATKTSAVFDGMTKRLGALATIAGGAAMIRGFDRMISRLDSIGKTADRLGLTTDALQELRSAAEQSGVAVNTFDMAIQRFGRRIAEARQGTGEARGVIEEMGIALTNASGEARPLEAVLADVADRMSEMSDQTDRNRIAMKLFDSEGVALVNMLRDGSDGLERMTERAREMGQVIEEDSVRAAEKLRTQIDLLTGAVENWITKTASTPLSVLVEALGLDPAREAVKDYEDAVARVIQLDRQLVAERAALADAAGPMAAKTIRSRIAGLEKERQAARAVISGFQSPTKTTQSSPLPKKTPQSSSSRSSGDNGSASAFDTAKKNLEDMIVAQRNSAFASKLAGAELAEFRAEVEAANIVEQARSKITSEQEMELGRLADQYIKAATNGASTGEGIFGALQPIATSLVSGLVGGETGAAVAPPTGQAAVQGFLGGGLYAKGGAFSGGRELTAFADGGVVNRPTVFPMARGMGLMGEAGPEAVMPLKRGPGGKLGVQATGGGDQYVTIHNSINASGLSPAQAAAMIERSNRRTLERVREQQTRGA